MNREIKKEKRYNLLQELLKENPFYNDRELAGLIGVSMSTIKNDCIALGIPSYKERVGFASRVSNAQSTEAIPDVVMEVEPDAKGMISVVTTEEMCFADSDVVTAGAIYSACEKLAAGIIGYEYVSTSFCNFKYIKPIKAGSRIIARGEVIFKERSTYILKVRVYCDQVEVFRGRFNIDVY